MSSFDSLHMFIMKYMSSMKTILICLERSLVSLLELEVLCKEALKMRLLSLLSIDNNSRIA